MNHDSRSRAIPSSRFGVAVAAYSPLLADSRVHADVLVCGELAGRVDMLPLLLATGIRALSVAPPLVPTVKEAVRRMRLK